jgi:hypothetical protein
MTENNNINLLEIVQQKPYQIVCKTPERTRLVTGFNTFDEAKEFAVKANFDSKTNPYKIRIKGGNNASN